MEYYILTAVIFFFAGIVFALFVETRRNKYFKIYKAKNSEK